MKAKQHKSIKQQAGDNAVQIGSVSNGGVVYIHTTSSEDIRAKIGAFRAINPPNPFINRDTQLIILADALRRGGVFQLCGMAGVGKTALAAKIADELGEETFPDGILWVTLSHGLDLETVCNWIVSAYGVKLGADILGTVRGVLHNKQALLVLDSAENAPEIVTPICEARGSATVLVTSRDRLVGVTSVEILNELRPLSKEPAVELIRSRLDYQSDEADVSDIERICELVGNLPLALILAAGYIQVYGVSLREYARALKRSPLKLLHLSERPKESVDVTLRLSWDRLSKESQMAMQVLATAPGDTASATAVADGMSVTVEAALEALRILRRHSIVVVEQERWGAHALLKAFAQKMMTEDLLKSIRHNLQAHYLKQVQECALTKDYQVLEMEHENILGVMKWLYEANAWLKVIEYANALDGYFAHRGYTHKRLERSRWWLEAAYETRRTYEIAKSLIAWADSNYILSKYREAQKGFRVALSIFEQVGNKGGRASAIYGLGKALYILCEYQEAREKCEIAAEIFHEIGDRDSEAEATCRLGYIYERMAEYPKAHEKYLAAQRIFQNTENIFGEADAIRGLGKIHIFRREYEQAQEKIEKALAMFREVHDRHKEAHALFRLGDLHYLKTAKHGRDSFRLAKEYLAAAIVAYQDVGDRLGEAVSVNYLGIISNRLGDYVQAIELHQKSLAVFQEIENRNGEALALRWLATAHRELREYQQAKKEYEISLSISREIGDRRREALTLDHLGRLAVKEGNHQAAVPYFEEATQIYEAMGMKWKLAKCRERLAISVNKLNPSG
ncbi:MAG: tetratricopeptide repeat protein [Actinomycetia bacterium]|nr:tetratricopeptide repeat protein [Actinomycetes bacterium]